MNRNFRKFLIVAIVIFSLTACFFLLKWGLKSWEAHSERTLLQDMAKFDTFASTTHTAAILLDETWYFPTHEVDMEKIANQQNGWTHTIATANAIFFDCFEKQDKAAAFPYRYVIYKCDIRGENPTEVLSIDGTFYNRDHVNTRDTFMFSYNEEKNNNNTRYIYLYNIRTDEVSLVSSGAEVTLKEAADRQTALEEQECVWTVTQIKKTIVLTSESITVTIPLEFWRGTEFEAAFPDMAATKISAYAQKDKVALTAWFDYILAGSMAVTFSYDPATQQLEFLSCVNPYDFEGVETIVILDKPVF